MPAMPWRLAGCCTLNELRRGVALEERVLGPYVERSGRFIQEEQSAARPG
jgi:hypothetical protein